tara:strand:+ start:1406 stop:1912 length:507 start_codon:yes stop_codon:yes gene_type:complete
MTFDIILAMDIKCGIGKDGKLPWNLPEELAWFKKVTMWTEDPKKQNAVIMGRKTWESLPEKYRPLPGRHNVVLTRNEEWQEPGVTLCNSFQESLDSLGPRTDIETIYVIGGAEVYKEALSHPDAYRVHLSTVPHDYECDVFVSIPGDFKMIADAHNVAFTSTLLARDK